MTMQSVRKIHFPALSFWKQGTSLKKTTSFLQIFSVLMSLSCASSFVHANEYVLARKIFLGGGVYHDTAENAAAAQVASMCKAQQFARDCAVVGPIEEYFDDYSWFWRTSWKYTYPSNPPKDYTQPVSSFITHDCPSGWVAYLLDTPVPCGRPDQPEPPCDVCDERAIPKIGNPIILSNYGIKQQVETDYVNKLGTLRFIRTYRSDTRRWLHNYQIFGIDFKRVDFSTVPPFACEAGLGSSSGEQYCYPYMGKRTVNSFGLRRGNGRLVHFGSATDLLPPKDVNDRVTRVLDVNGLTVAWNVVDAQGSTERFNLDGRLETSTAVNGQITSFGYSDESTLKDIAPKPGLLLSVTDAFGQQLKFTYDSSAQISTMIDPAGGVFSYTYNAGGNVSSVTYPGGWQRQYVYGELDKTENVSFPYLLTGIIDENNDRFATFAYNSGGKPLSTEHAGGVEKYQANYPNYYTATATDALGTMRVYNILSVLGVKKSSGIAEPGPGGVGSVSTFIGYDANGNIENFTNFNGAKTNYVYDLSRNLETRRIEGLGTLIAKTISTDWHPSFRRPLRIAEPKRITMFTYDVSGNVLTKSVQATTDANGTTGFSATPVGPVRSWSYTYSPVGQLLTVKSPRTDVNDLTSYAYDAAGNLSAVTNAAGHITALSNYDANGNVGRITDPNGLVADLTYTPRGWLASSTIGGEATSYDYDGVGQLLQATMADGTSIRYNYDPAHRLTSIVDRSGNSIIYKLDLMGNRTSEQIKDAAGNLARQISRAYDPLNRLKQITGGLQ